MTTCPTPDRLDLWVNERLAPADQAALAAHIDGCPRCQAALDRLTAEPPAANSSAPDPRLSAILDRLKETIPARPAEPGEPPAPPGYELLGVLGRGGMGIVYKARQQSLNRTVAVKLLDRPAPDADTAARFRREGEALGRLAHPNVVQVYEVGVADGRPFLVMEYVAGGTLSQFAGGKPVPPATAAGLVEQVAWAVQHAHDQGILHRDLKPGNILLGTDEKRPDLISSLIPPPSSLDPKVTDFGLARSIDPGESLTRTGVIVGTPSYMAPEQVAGDARLTPACDVYGLGAILYELLTGRPPFTGANPADILLNVRDQDPVPPSRVIPSVPRDLNTICLKCLGKDPKRRYPSAGAVAEDLRRWQAGEPILARPTGAAERAWKWARRRKAAAALVGVGLFLLLVGLPTITALWLRADTERRRADMAREHTERSLYAAHIAQAELHYRLNDLTRTRSHLTACEPAPGRPDPRGWEWFYLHGLAYSEHVDLPAPPAPDGRGRTLYAVAFSPDGDLVAAGGGVRSYLSYKGTEPGELAVWDAGTGRPALAPGDADPLGVTAVAFGPNGRLFTVGADVWFWQTRLWQGLTLGPATWPGPVGLLRARDARTGAVHFERLIVPPAQGRWTGPQNPALAVSPDGSRVAAGTAVGVTVFDGRTGKPVFDCPEAVAASFAPGGAELRVLTPVVGPEGTARGEVRAYDAASGRVLRRHDVGELRPRRVAFSHSGEWLARAVGGGEVAVSPAGGPGPESRVRVGAPDVEVSALAVGPDGRLLATGGPDGVVRVWDVESGKPHQVFRGHTNRVLAVAFDPAGRQLVSVGWDRATKVWDVGHQPEFANVGGTPPAGERRAEDCVFTPDGNLLVLRLPGGDLEWWGTAADRLLRREPLKLPADKRRMSFPGRMAAFAPGGARLAVAAGPENSRVTIWDTDPVRRLHAFECRQRVAFLAMSADGRRVAGTAWRRGRAEPAELFVWEVGRDEPVLHVVLDGQACPALALAPDGKRLVAAVRPNATDQPYAPGRVRVWDVDAGREERSFDPGADVTALAFDGPGGRLAAATAAPAVRVWDARTWAELQSIPCLEEYDHLAFAPDGRRLAGATHELITLWDPAAGEEVLTLRGRPRTGSELPFNPRVFFGPSGRKLAAVQNDYTVHIWTAGGYPALSPP